MRKTPTRAPRPARQLRSSQFLAETSLELLARRLRVLGFDVEVLPGASLEALYEAAQRENRTVLTPSARHPRRYAHVPAVIVAREDAARAVREIEQSYQPPSAPFSRCTECNVFLERRPVAEAVGQAPDAIVRGRTHIMHCPRCGRWYWRGSHVDRLCAWLQGALGRTIVPPVDLH